MRTITGFVCLVMAIGAGPAAAQTIDFSGMNVNGTPRVIVTDLSGEETEGRLIVWTPSSIVVDSNGTKRPFTPAEAVRVDRRGDSVKEGFFILAGLGLLGGLISDCPEGRSPCVGHRVAVSMIGMGLWGAIGAGIDALIPGRREIWHASGRKP